jgi:hypothetical protein
MGSPWVRLKGLASKILALSAKHMPHDWRPAMGLVSCWKPWWMAPVFVELAIGLRTGFTLGKPPGRGRMDRAHQAHGQWVKDIYVYHRTLSRIISPGKWRHLNGLVGVIGMRLYPTRRLPGFRNRTSIRASMLEGPRPLRRFPLPPNPSTARVAAGHRRPVGPRRLKHFRQENS